MRLLLSLLGVVIAMGFAFIAGVMNWRYGLSLGRSVDDQLLFAATSVAVDATKMLMPFFFWWSLAHRRWFAGTLAALALVGCVSYSIAGIAGFADLARSTATGSLLAKKDDVLFLRAELVRKQSLLKALGLTEPVAVIEHKLDEARQDIRWRSTRECTDATLSSSREYCATYRSLQAARERSVAARDIEQEIATIRQKIEPLTAVAEIDRGDPRAGILSRLTGWEILRVQTGLSLLLVGIIEFMSTFGIFIALSHGALAKTAGRGSGAAAADEQCTTSPNVTSETPRLLTREPTELAPAELTTIARFAVDCLKPKAGGRVLVASLYPRYCRWCREANQQVASRETFLLMFSDLCRESGFELSGEADMVVAEGFRVVA